MVIIRLEYSNARLCSGSSYNVLIYRCVMNSTFAKRRENILNILPASSARETAVTSEFVMKTYC